MEHTGYGWIVCCILLGVFMEFWEESNFNWKYWNDTCCQVSYSKEKKLTMVGSFFVGDQCG